MKGFKKLALATAVAALPAAGFAMEPLSDDTMSNVTGQDGISIDLATNLTTDIYIHDTDGFTGAVQAGALVISNVGLSGSSGAAPISIAIDAGDETTTAQAGDASLQIAATLGAVGNDIIIDLGELSVAESNRDDGSWGQANGSATVIDMGSITIPETTITIQLANEVQGSMIDIATTISGGISLSNFAINDIDSTGAIGATSLAIVDNGGTDLTLDVSGDATASGLQLTLNAFGSGTGADIRIVDQYLGDSGTPIGDVEIVGLDLTGTTITISGK